MCVSFPPSFGGLALGLHNFYRTQSLGDSISLKAVRSFGVGTHNAVPLVCFNVVRNYALKHIAKKHRSRRTAASLGSPLVPSQRFAVILRGELAFLIDAAQIAHRVAVT